MSRSLSAFAREFFGVGIGALVALGLIFSIFGTAWATVDSNAAASLTVGNQTIKASSSPLAVIGLNLASADQALASTTISFVFSGSGTTTDLATLGTATSSGVAIYRDDKNTGTPGSFDATDDVIVLASAPAWTSNAGGTHSTTTLTFSVAEVVPANNAGGNAGNDYFIVVQSDDSAVNTHAFKVQIYPGVVGWAAGMPAGPTAVSSDTITVDTVAPTVNTNTTGPANGSTGVPISTFIHMGFSEPMDQSSLNSTNITLTQGGTPVASAVRPSFDGFDLIVSSPPSYAAGSRVAKANTVSTAFYNISGMNSIFPQGAYVAPSVGDIVFTQFDTFPPEIGLVTNNTLTSGTFAINGNALFRPSQVTKFATPTKTGAVSDATAVGIGDLIVVNTTANPTDTRYNFHIVTTNQAVNNSGLRLDGSGDAPTYVSGSKFSTIMPAATSSMTAAGHLNATTTFNAGDLVFAKLVAGGDNLNTYAWHIVTTAEVVQMPTGPGTTSALRLDNAAARAQFAGSSVLAKIAPAASTTVDSGAQDMTTYSIGDFLFGKVSANAANLGAYAWHFISNGATGATSTSLRLDNVPSNLTPSVAYIVAAGTGVKDAAGNPLAATSTITFTTGATGSTNVTPPFVQNTQPQAGSQNHPRNAPVKLIFSVGMKSDAGANAVDNTAVVKLMTDVNGQPGSQVTATNTYDSTTNTVTITPSANLDASTGYVVQVLTTAQSTNNIPLPNEYRLYFRTAAGTDSTAPTVLGVNPSNGTTNAAVGQVFTAGFSEDMDPSTITTATLKLVTQIGGTAVSGNVSYSPQSRSASFIPSTALATNTGYRFTVGAGGTGPADLVGNHVSATSTTFATTTASADVIAPSITFANADNFGIAVTFSETMKVGGGPNAADNIVNYTLESPVGTTIGLGGKTVTYDGMTKTARISGLSLQNGNQFKVTVSTSLQDLAGNSISTSGTPAGNVSFGSVQNSTQTGGQLGPGSGTIDQGQQGMNPTRVTPMTRSAGATSNYKIELLTGTSVPAGGQIVLTFPTGFDVTNAAKVATSSSFCNADLNGAAAGVPIIASVATTSDSITLNLGTTDGTGANSFLCIDLSGIVNSTVPSTSGYSVDIKTRDTAANNRIVLENKTASPFFLGTAGSITLTVNVFNDANANLTSDSGERIANVRVFLFSPATGGNSASTNSSGVVTFANLAAGDYMVGIDPGSLASASSTVSYNSVPQPFPLTATNNVKNIIVSGGGSSITLSGTVTGPANTSVDIFAASPNGFSKKTLTLTGGADAYSIPIQPNQTYNVGVGPAMPEAFFTPGAPPPPPPTFTFMPPPNQTVIATTTNVTGINFTLTAANKTITGTVQDSSGSAVSNAGVFARPVSNTTGGSSSNIGFGSGGMTNTSGAFSINVIPGTYLVGVFKPGMPSVPDQQITVPSSGDNVPATRAFKLGSASTLTISGTVKDDGGNAIPYAGVGGRKVNSTSDTSAIGGGQGNFVGGPTDANGAFTLYVTNGVWVIEAFAPGFGKLGTKTVTVSGSSLSGQDFSAQNLTLGTLQGSTTRASAAVQGVMVRAEGGNGANMAVSDSSGTYTMKLPVGTYSVTCFFPGQGDSAPTTGVSVTNGGTTNSHCALAAPITVTVKITDGTNPISGAFVDGRTSTGRGYGTNEGTASTTSQVYTLTLAPGTYTIRAGHPAFGPIGSTANVSTTQTITYTAPVRYNVTGTVSASGVGANNAYVSLTGIPTGQTNTITTGAQTDSSGAFTISIPAGSYQIRADKPGFISSTPSTVTVSGNTAVGTLTLTTASLTISGTVILNGSGVSGAFVDATNGSGGFAVAQTDSSGAYSLSVSSGTWNLTAHSIGYEGAKSGVTAGLSGQNITLSAISGFTVKPERQESVTPTAGGIITNSDISGFTLNIPANALGTGSNSATVETQPNTAVPNAINGTVLSKNAVSISAVDSSGQPIKTLNDEVTIIIPYDQSSIPSGSSESDLQLGVWNDATQSYDILSTTVDTTNNTLTSTVSHFSDFAPIVPSQSSSNSGGSGSGSSGSSGGSASSGSGGSIWSATPVATMTKTIAKAQIVYPDGRVVYVDQNLGVATGSTRGTQAVPVRAATTRFAVLLKQGSRHADVARLQKALGVDPTGYFGALTRAAVEAFQVKHGLAKKGDQGFGIVGPKTRAKLNELFGEGVSVASSQASAQGQTQSGNAAVAGGTLARAVKVGSIGDDVKLLQVILNTDADTRIADTGAGSLGNETRLFGRLTLKAIQKFQEKHGIAKPGDEGYGNVGPKTRAKLNAVLAAWLAANTTPAPVPAPTPTPTATSTGSAATTTASVSAAVAATTSSTATTGGSVSATLSATTTATTTGY